MTFLNTFSTLIFAFSFTQYAIHNTTYEVRKLSYEIIKLFLQNEPIFGKSQVNVSPLITTNYEQRTMNYEVKNEPKRTQNESNLSCRSLWRSRNKPNFYTIGSLYCLQLPLTFVNLIRNSAYEYRQ
jgi:hypothetical protein